MDFKAAIDKEIEAIEASLKASPDPRLVKLHELQRLRSLYSDEATPPSSTPLSNSVASLGHARRKPRGRRMSPERQKAIDAAKEILRGETEPMKTAALYRRVAAEGIELGGKDPASNFSALLYHHKEFRSHGRAGWTLAKVATSDNEKTVDVNPGEEQSTALFSNPSIRPVEPEPGGAQ